eukprot:symbB.v1.2.032587.t1/scaffold3931.1/size48062/1
MAGNTSRGTEVRKRRYSSGTIVVACIVASCRPFQWLFAYAGRGISPLKSDIEVLGVLRGRLVIGFHPGLEVINVFANQTKLKPLKDNKWLEQERRYGERDCKYAEFSIPPLPAEINVLGRAVGGRIVVNVTESLGSETVPSAAQWNEQFMRRKARSAPPRRRLQDGQRVQNLQDSGWS